MRRNSIANATVFDPMTHLRISIVCRRKVFSTEIVAAKLSAHTRSGRRSHRQRHLHLRTRFANALAGIRRKRHVVLISSMARND